MLPSTRLIMEETKVDTTEVVPVTERGSAKIANYRLVKTIGKGHYSK